MDFFSRYSDPKYDLWRGGRAKGIVYRPWIFRKIWGEEWKPVTLRSGTYDTGKDRFCRIEFDPVETRALRLEVKLREGFSGGILEWRTGAPR